MRFYVFPTHTITIKKSTVNIRFGRECLKRSDTTIIYTVVLIFHTSSQTSQAEIHLNNRQNKSPILTLDLAECHATQSKTLIQDCKTLLIELRVWVGKLETTKIDV